MQNKINDENFLRFQTWNMCDIKDFRTTWKRELFFRKTSSRLTARCLIKKSIIITQIRLSRQVNNLTKELQTDRQILKNSLAEHLQQVI
jgi:hypothetical protein